MKGLGKVGLVTAGYAGALLVAFAVVAVYVAATSRPDEPGHGNALLFLIVLGIAAVVPTAAVLRYLRLHRSFWLVLVVAAIVIAAGGLAAFFDYFFAQIAAPWSSLGVVRLLLAPLFAIAFLVAGLFAPSGPFRLVLLVASLSEAAIIGWVALTWFHRGGT